MSLCEAIEYSSNKGYLISLIESKQGIVYLLTKQYFKKIFFSMDELINYITIMKQKRR